MIVLFDTNVVLDLLLDREPFSEDVAQLFSIVEKGEIIGYVCATTVTTIHYLATKAIGSKEAKKSVHKLLSLVAVAPVNRTVLENALEGRYKDFEDGVVSEAAHQVEAGAIVTRNIGDFKWSSVRAYTPTELLKILLASENKGE